MSSSQPQALDSEYLWGSTQIICLLLTIYIFIICTISILIPWIKSKSKSSSSAAAAINQKWWNNGIKLSRWIFLLCSVIYAIQVTLTHIISPNLSSRECGGIVKSSFAMFTFQKMALYMFFFFKARTIQTAVNANNDWTVLNKLSFAGISSVLVYSIAGVVHFDAVKIPRITQECVFITPDNFYVLFIVVSIQDFFISLMLLYQFVRPLQMHVIDMKETMQINRRKASSSYDLSLVIRMNIVCGMSAAASTITTFALIGWVLYSKKLDLAITVVPISSIAEIAISNTLVFIISSSRIWKYLLCVPCREMWNKRFEQPEEQKSLFKSSAMVKSTVDVDYRSF